MTDEPGWMADAHSRPGFRSYPSTDGLAVAPGYRAAPGKTTVNGATGFLNKAGFRTRHP